MKLRQANSMKNFDEKLSKQFESLNVSILNEPKYKTHLYADYVELVCLLSNEYVSQNDIIERLQDNGETFEITEIPDGEFDQYDAEIQDKAESWINLIFDYLIERKSIYGDSYPFTIDKIKGIRLSKKNDLIELKKKKILN